MAILAAVLFNGVDIQNTYGANVTSIEGDSPISMLGSDPKLTIGGNVIAASNDTLQTALENIGELVGWWNDGPKVCSVQIFRINASSALTTNSGFYMVEIESFNVSPIEPVQSQLACLFKITFRIVEVLNTAGVTTRDYTLAGNSAGYASVYFEDTSALQGAYGLVGVLAPANDGTYLSMFSMADQPDIIQAFTPYISNNYIKSAAGLYGHPAMSFPVAETGYLFYPNMYAFPVYNTNNFTIAIRFKKLYSVGSADDKYLFSVTGTTNTPFIKVAAGAGSYLTVGCGGITASVDGTNVSAAYWNTVILTSNGGTLTVTLKTPSATTTASQTGGAVCGDPGPYMYIGTLSGTSYRSDCIIGEVAIYKHALSTGSGGACFAYCSANEPIIRYPQFDLNRNLLFYLDFAAGSLKGKCNRMSGFRSLIGATAGGTKWVIDSDRQTVNQVGTNVATSEVNDLPNCSPVGSGGFRFPSVSRYNRFLCQIPTTGTTTLSLAYSPRKRR